MSENRCLHLTNEDISVFVDTIYYKQKHILPENKLRHIWKCKNCEQQIVQVYNIRYQENPAFPLGEKKDCRT